MHSQFSRHAPSARYRELLSQYQAMHRDGDVHNGISAESTFAGQSLPRHCAAIKTLIDKYSAQTVLDYGAGKGAQYQPVTIKLSDGSKFPSIIDFWNVESVTCFDPGYEPFSTLPDGKFDGVICTDVLEHCPEADIPWILDEIFSFARSFVYANVACYPARKQLANGENAHCTIKDAGWWQSVVKLAAQRTPGVDISFHLDRVVDQGAGRREMESVSLHV